MSRVLGSEAGHCSFDLDRVAFLNRRQRGWPACGTREEVTATCGSSAAEVTANAASMCIRVQLTVCIPAGPWSFTRSELSDRSSVR
jgi:hypothetical protein